MRSLHLAISLTVLVTLVTGCGAGVPSSGVATTTSPPPAAAPAAPQGGPMNVASTPASASATANKLVLSLATPTPIVSVPTPSPTSPYFVDYYLTLHPSIAAAILWSPTYGTYVPWSQWTAQQKADLRQAFAWEWQWYTGGMNVYGGWAYADPPNNLEPCGPNSPWTRTVLDSTTAWHLYVSFVAHALAVDAGGWVPYKLDAYNDQELRRLLDSNYLVMPDSNANNYYDCATAGAYVVAANLTPSHPTYVFKWLKTNQLIGVSDVDTIARLLDWCRWNLVHTFGDFTLANSLNYFPYPGAAPLRMMIEGTHCTDPQYQAWFPDLLHWTEGCGGTSNFIAEVLRSANIPVAVTVSGGQHQVPHFLHPDLYLSHGDDPYDGRSKATPPFPVRLLLVDGAQFKTWFGVAGEAAERNVSRRVVELTVSYPTDEMLAKYVDDVKNGRSRANSLVYNQCFQSSTWSGPYFFFTVAELEARGLWSNLDRTAKGRGLL